MEIVVGTSGPDTDETVASLEPSFEITVVDPERVPETVTEQGAGAVLAHRNGAAGSVLSIVAEIPESVPTIVVADPTGISPEAVFERGAVGFVDETGAGVGPRVRRRLKDALETGTEPGLPDRRDELGALIENAPVQIGIVDADGTIVYANEATVAFVKADDSDEIEGEAVMSFAASETADATRRRFRQVIENREATAPMEQVFIDNDGDRRTAIVTTTPVTYQGEPAGQFVLNDITAYKQIEQELRRERDFVERLLNAVEDVFFVIDKEGQFIRWNDTLAAVTGYSDGELRELSISDIVSPDHHDRLPELIDPDRTLEEPIELAIRTDDDERTLHEVRAVRTVDGQDTPCVCGVARDVTDRKRRERELLEFKQAVEDAGHAIFITDTDGEIQYVNPAFESLTGYSEREAIGATPRLLRSGEHDDEYFVRLWETILGGETWDKEIINETKNGELYHAEQTITPIVEDGDVTGFVAIQQDITALKQYERELERRNDELERFARVVSHDLRSPLSVATGNVELASDTLGTDPEAARNSLATAVDALGRMDRLIEDVLALAREGEVVSEPSSVSLESVVTASFDHVSAESGQLSVAEDARILADQGRLRSLFENLFRNAVEHGSTSPDSNARQDAVEHGSTSPASETQQDAVDHGGPDVSIRVGTISADSGIDGFYVADDGPGIPPEEREPVFESGYTTDDARNGLGLAIVKRIAEAHGWTIGVTESVDGGARFEVRGVDVPTAED